MCIRDRSCEAVGNIPRARRRERRSSQPLRELPRPPAAATAQPAGPPPPRQARPPAPPPRYAAVRYKFQFAASLREDSHVK
eukprot:6571154-Pyramimonas_sp.AAC.1